MRKRKGGFLPVFAPAPSRRAVLGCSVGASGSSLPSEPGVNAGPDVSESQAQHLRALGLLPEESHQPRDEAPTHRYQAVPKPSASETASRALAPRRDAPALNYSRGAANRTHSDDFDRKQLLDRLDSDVHARSSMATQASLLKTWCKFHHEWFRDGTPPFPITCQSLRACAALFKFRGYRSFENYLSRAKREHVIHGHVWTQELDLVGRECSRSVGRGLGPARQSAEFDVHKIANLDIGTDAVIEDGPVNPKALCILGCYFLTREIELSLAVVENFKVNILESGPEVEWRLPVSKTDPRAVSVTRTWKCLCITSQSFPCPAHVAMAHMAFLQDRFSVDGRLSDSLPLFPTQTGAAAEKESVVRTVEYFAKECGTSLVDQLGRRAYGGHSFRVTGSRMLARMGLELYKIALLARWASNVIMRYVSEAPLATLTEDCRRLLAGDDMDRTLVDLRAELRVNARKLEDMEARLFSLSELREPVVKPDRRTRYLLNCISGVWHETLLCNSEISPSLWQTKCGWKFGSAVVEHSEVLPPTASKGKCCNKCLAEVRGRSCRPDASSSSDSS
jgi:hypothetical protein